MPILVVGNRTQTRQHHLVNLKNSSQRPLSNGYLLETSHASHVVYPGNDCVNEHVHRALIEAEYTDKRVFCERED